MVKQLKEFSANMLGWGNLLSPAVQLFAANMAAKLGLDDPSLEKVNLFVDKRESDNLVSIVFHIILLCQFNVIIMI